jgi:four helix bundle protein
MQRAAVSIPSNIAEGFGRRTTADFLRSLYIAYGSICELQTQVLLATKLDYLPEKEAGSLLQSVGDTERLTKALIKALERKLSSDSCT